MESFDRQTADQERRKVSLKLPKNKPRREVSAGRQLYKCISRHLNSKIDFKPPYPMADLWKHKSNNEVIIKVGPYSWGHNRIRLSSQFLKSMWDYFETEPKSFTDQLHRWNVKVVNCAKVDWVHHDPEAIDNYSESQSYVNLRFGINWLSPKEIIEQEKENDNFISKHKLFKLLYDNMKATNSKRKMEDADWLLDFSDFKNDDEYERTTSREQFKRYTDLIDVISCSSLFPNISFSITQKDKLKIAATSLSQLLINKPENPSDRFKTFYSGYLCLDSNNRLLPVQSNASVNKPFVGVWVYGLDIPAYRVKGDSDQTRTSNANPLTDKDKSRIRQLESPYLWAALVKFLLDESIQSRISTGENKDSFVLVHFAKVSSSPQFYEFRLSPSDQMSVRNSKATERSGGVNGISQSKWCSVLSLNNLPLTDESPVKCNILFSKAVDTLNIYLLLVTLVILGCLEFPLYLEFVFIYEDS